MRQSQLTPGILNATLKGLEIQSQRIEGYIAQVMSMLGGKPTPSSGGEHRPRRKFSAATRRKMSLAQRRRQAALRGEAVADQSAVTNRTPKAAKPAKRRFSAQGLANIRAAVKRRWAVAKKQVAATKKATVTKVAEKKSAAKKAAPVASKTVVKKVAKKAVKKASPKPSATTAPVQAEAVAATTTTA